MNKEENNEFLDDEEAYIKTLTIIKTKYGEHKIMRRIYRHESGMFAYDISFYVPIQFWGWCQVDEEKSLLEIEDAIKQSGEFVDKWALGLINKTIEVS